MFYFEVTKGNAGGERGTGRQGREPDSKAMWSTVYQRLPRGAPDR